MYNHKTVIPCIQPKWRYFYAITFPFNMICATLDAGTCVPIGIGGKGNSMKFKYCRIQGKELAANTRTGKGIFSMLNQLVTNGVMDEEDVGLFKEIDSWFVEELPFPPQCRRQEKVICYFKLENSDMMLKMIQPLLWLLERYCHPYYVVYTNFPGEIVYEDDYQIDRKSTRLNSSHAT